jgi:hypothetical protein
MRRPMEERCPPAYTLAAEGSLSSNSLRSGLGRSSSKANILWSFILPKCIYCPLMGADVEPPRPSFLQRFEVLSTPFPRHTLLLERFSGREFVLRELIDCEDPSLESRLKALSSLKGEHVVHLVEQHFADRGRVCGVVQGPLLLFDLPHRSLRSEVEERTGGR